MWSLIVIASAFCYGALAVEDELCQLRAERACRIYSIVPNEFPGSMEELENGCSSLYKVKQCFADVLRNCSLGITDDIDEDFRNEVDDGDRLRIKDAHRLMDVTTQICDEDSELHRSFVPYLSCLKSGFEIEFEEQTCRDYSNKAMDFLRNRIEGKARMAGGSDDKFREVRNEIMYCLRILFTMNCVISRSMKACDAGVKEPMLEIIEKGGSLDDQCPASTRIDVIELLDALKLVARREIYIRELIRTDSFF